MKKKGKFIVIENFDGDLSNEDCSKKWVWQDESLEQKSGLFTCIGIGFDNDENSISPHTVGFDITLNHPSEIFFDIGKGPTHYQKVKSATRHSFNFIYGSGIYHPCLVVRKFAKNVKNRKWQKKSFTIKVIPRDRDNEIISNFFQSKKVGQYYPTRGSGLQVAFSISTGITPKKIKWDFGDKGADGNIREETRKWQQLLAEDYTYKKTKKFKGSVTVWPQKGKEIVRTFEVLITKPRGT